MPSIKKDEESFFQKNQNSLDLWGGKDQGKGVRECQLGAYWAVWAHFTSSDEAAMVSLPTGSGKTALMMALSFGWSAKRVLIVTPAVILRDQTANNFENLDILKEIGVLENYSGTPRVLSNSKQMRSAAEWKSLEQYDVVTAHPKTISPAEPGVVAPPEGLFDVVFIDEAHHTAAPTWAAILSEFKKSKRVLLTATPFRRDKRRIRAALVYHYSIGKALDAGIYRPVEYVGVDGGNNRANRDKALCAAAKSVLEKERKLGNQSKLLIRADRVEWSRRLEELYEKEGVKVKAVDYEKPWTENQAVIDQVKKGELDGMVCVGMLGEGLDLPELKIAVLHAAPRSFPFTLQFVGRVSRFSSTQTGDAYLLSVPDEVRGEVRRLHRNDANWRRLIPKLLDEVVGKVTDLRHFRSPYGYEELDVNPLALRPFFSVRVYKASARQVNFEADIDLADEVGICLRERPYDDTLILITECEGEPVWAKDTGILETKLDFHLYHQPKNSGLLFEYTTANGIAGDIRDCITERFPARISPNQIMQALKDGGDGEYFMVGLKNAMGTGPSQPTYKTLMGREAQAAVNPTDGKVFCPGHALVRIDDDETRGVGALKSRVWAIKRDGVEKFRDWCVLLVSDLKGKTTKQGLPQLEFLAQSEELTTLSEKPLAVILNDSIFRAVKHIEATDNEGEKTSGDIDPFIEIGTYKKGNLECHFHFHSTAPAVSFNINLASSSLWEITDERELRIRLEFSDDEIFDSGLREYLEKYPPKLVMPKGGVVVRRDYWKPPIQPGPLPASTLVPQKWNGCDITKETGTPPGGKLNVQDWTENKLKSEANSSTIIIKDDRSREIADFVVIDQKEMIISFYHCKGFKTKAKKGNVRDAVKDSVNNAYEVLGQACRSVVWVRSPALLTRLHERVSPQKKSRSGGSSTQSPIIKGDVAQLVKIKNSFISNMWKYKVVAVQPGLKCAEIEKSNKLNPLMISTFEWVKTSDSDFILWGS